MPQYQQDHHTAHAIDRKPRSEQHATVDKTVIDHQMISHFPVLSDKRKEKEQKDQGKRRIALRCRPFHILLHPLSVYRSHSDILLFLYFHCL